MNIVLMPRLIKPNVYDRMAALAWGSFKKHLAGDWTAWTVWEDDWIKLWREVFLACQELNAHHNVLLIGADTIAVKPVEVFGEYGALTMFWHTDPPRKDPFPGYLNSEPMYIPKGLSQSLWDAGMLTMLETPESHYDRIQVIWNEMYWKQDPRPVLDPAMNWSPVVASPITEDYAKIIHYHASRGAESVLAKMEAKCA